MVSKLLQRGTPLSGAKFSSNEKYRYALWRVWQSDLPRCVFIGLNPSTADERVNDPTVTRCINYAKRWGCGSLTMLNMFAFRATDPRDMKACEHPIGLHNDEEIIDWVGHSALTVCAWGTHGKFLSRSERLLRRLEQRGFKLYALKLTQQGHPSHPLYLKSDLVPRRWLPRERTLLEPWPGLPSA